MYASYPKRIRAWDEYTQKRDRRTWLSGEGRKAGHPGRVPLHGEDEALAPTSPRTSAAAQTDQTGVRRDCHYWQLRRAPLSFLQSGRVGLR